jgi:hypothetical protein
MTRGAGADRRFVLHAPKQEAAFRFGGAENALERQPDCESTGFCREPNRLGQMLTDFGAKTAAA